MLLPKLDFFGSSLLEISGGTGGGSKGFFPELRPFSTCSPSSLPVSDSYIQYMCQCTWYMYGT